MLPLAYYIHDLDPFLIRFTDTWGIRYYGLAYLLAFVVGFFLYRWLARKGYSDLREDQVGDFIFGGAIFGVVLGGRLGYMLFYNLSGFLADPLVFFRFGEGGMSAHGGILGLTLYTLWFARRHKVSWLNIGDNLCVVAPVGLFLGRIANFINGELYGRIASVPWAVQFPRELQDPSVPYETKQLAVLEAMALDARINSPEAIIEAVRFMPELKAQLAATLSPRHPSQLYEAFFEGAVLFAILWFMRTRLRLPNGVLTGTFFLGYALFRSACEFFRQPDAGMMLGVTAGQFLSVWLVLIGLAFLFFATRKKLVSPSADR